MSIEKSIKKNRSDLKKCIKESLTNAKNNLSKVNEVLNKLKLTLANDELQKLRNEQNNGEDIEMVDQDYFLETERKRKNLYKKVSKVQENQERVMEEVLKLKNIYKIYKVK